MNINHFAYFIEAVRENSITKAAESLFISQSTISKAIKSLEQAYNTELIDRKARKFKLTSAGEIFYNSAVKIVSNYQSETEVLATLLHSHRGKLTLGIPPVTITIIHSLLHQFHYYINIVKCIQKLICVLWRLAHRLLFPWPNQVPLI